jgi:hypothetical protein
MPASDSTYVNESGPWPRWLNIALGVWLFISAFVWPHTANSQANTWIVGVLVVAFALWGMFTPPVRWVNTVLAVWLFFSTFFFAHITAGTVWNNAIVAILVFILSLVPGSMHSMTPGRPQQPVPT